MRFFFAGVRVRSCLPRVRSGWIVRGYTTIHFRASPPFIEFRSAASFFATGHPVAGVASIFRESVVLSLYVFVVSLCPLVLPGV